MPRIGGNVNTAVSPTRLGRAAFIYKQNLNKDTIISVFPQYEFLKQRQIPDSTAVERCKRAVLHYTHLDLVYDITVKADMSVFKKAFATLYYELIQTVGSTCTKAWFNDYTSLTRFLKYIGILVRICCRLIQCQDMCIDLNFPYMVRYFVCRKTRLADHELQ